ncbi:SDR family oxidoreductase [Klugiella xanthotipulae]|uniref:Short-subunit dehydrogenase n=1 Tax=Klugiella xanthotipulae TaxID=244735 RepID=A0A543HH48_9MICO|nr:SDR family oxidoreductase [Klugiella xanthotipulae]TQM57658.1 hypothetical protein FB466_2654 [Klugiella xanthotipulae]
MSHPVTFHGKTALVTGASTGIGVDLAARLAAEGSNLVLVARSADKLNAVAERLRGERGVTVTVIPLDLGAPESAEKLVAELDERGIRVDILLNNAGFGSHGDLAQADPVRMAEQVQLNVGTLVGLTTRLLPGMVQRRDGVIMNVASTAAFQAVPHMAVYGATKAFVLSFSRALWAETRGTGVRVLAIAPGATETPFFSIAGEHASLGKRRRPEQVVDTAFRALRAGRPSAVDGFVNACLARIPARLVSERLLIAVTERAMRA